MYLVTFHYCNTQLLCSFSNISSCLFCVCVAVEQFNLFFIWTMGYSDKGLLPLCVLNHYAWYGRGGRGVTCLHAVDIQYLLKEITSRLKETGAAVGRKSSSLKHRQGLKWKSSVRRWSKHSKVEDAICQESVCVCGYNTLYNYLLALM